MDHIKRIYAKFWERIQAKVTSTDEEQAAFRRKANPILAERGFSIMAEPPTDSCRHKYFFGINEFCRRPRLGESGYCLWHDRSDMKYDDAIVSKYYGEKLTFTEAIEREVRNGGTLSGAYLVGARLDGHWSKRGADLHDADLRGADLRDAHLSYGTLRNANLALANLESAYLSDVNLEGVRLTNALLFNTKLRENNLTSVKGLTKGSFRNSQGLVPRYRILETYPEQAEPMYRALMSYFSSLGMLDDASWAAYRYRVMHHAILRKRLSPLVCLIEAGTRDMVAGSQIDLRRAFEVGFPSWISAVFEFMLSWLYRWISGYGEKPARVGMTSALVILIYACVYSMTHALTERGFQAALYFSAVTFTTLGYGDILPRTPFRLMAASEAILGLLLAGLFLFALSRRSVGRA